MPLHQHQTGELCDTLFYQGLGSSQTQALKYVGDQRIVATTGELMWATGRNSLPPLKVIYKLHIGTEIADVDLHPFNDFLSYFNPIKLIGSSVSRIANWHNGFHFAEATPKSVESVAFHAPKLAEFSIGQETDMRSHRRKYDAWLDSKDKTSGLILWGVSRGTAATFCAFSKEKYPEVKLVVLEGAIDSVEKIIPKRFLYYPGKFINSSLAFFKKHNITQYAADGPSPLKCVDEFPERVPVVFITSEKDTVVTCENTENIANTLARRGKNDVYLLKLKHSSHPSYMFDNLEDHDSYETFMHAIYQKYQLQHDPELALRGAALIESATLHQCVHDDSSLVCTF